MSALLKQRWLVSGRDVIAPRGELVATLAYGLPVEVARHIAEAHNASLEVPVVTVLKMREG